MAQKFVKDGYNLLDRKKYMVYIANFLKAKNVQILCMTFCFTSFFSMKAQIEPQYTQYLFNIGSFNPAYSVSLENADVTGLYRAQFIDIPGSPRNIRLGGNFPLKNKRNGISFNAISDQLGPASQTFINVAYAFQVNLTDNTKLSFGLDAGAAILDVDFSEGTFENPGEPILGRQQINEFFPTVGAGTFLYSDDWYIGLSVPNVLTDDIFNEDVATIIEDRFQFNLIGGYVFNFTENLKFKPAFLANYINGAPLNLNISANFLIGNVVTAGASYRLDNAVSGLAGFQLSNGTFVGYSYDYSINGLSGFNQGSHEVILKFYLGKGDSNRTGNKKLKGKPKQIATPRFF